MSKQETTLPRPFASGESGEDRPAIVVSGPTASGKSALALAIAQSFDGVVINADALQVYRELSILTARPDAGATSLAPHRLYGFLPADERCSAARWRRLALSEIAAAHAAGKLPVLCGGTGFYIKALEEGLAEIPEIPSDVLARGEALLAAQGVEGLRAAMLERDPDLAARVGARDKQRLLRAWSVQEATGRSLTDWQRGPAAPDGAAALRCLHLVLLPPRAALDAAIAARFRAMLAAGALEEARHMAALGLDPSLPACKALGLPELARHLAGELDLEAATQGAIEATRRYAKRQGTWLRGQVIGQKKSVKLLNAQFSESDLEEFFPIIRQFLLTVPA